MKSFTFATLALTGAAVAQNTYSAVSAVHAAKATALSTSPTSHVKGKAFDRFVQIWLENADFDIAQGDPNLSALAKQGLVLSNYFGVTHPSEPNYCSSMGGDNFGMDNDDFNNLPKDVATLIDLLEDKGVSWGEYQQQIPYSGYEGYDWINQTNGANNYVRKHNPAILYDSVTESKQRLSQIKNFTEFEKDLAANKLPQWMFVTPNMLNDGHDTSITRAGQWTRDWLTPLLKNKNFDNGNTLVLVTFDEVETYTESNRVFSILLGSAVPKNLIGTEDSSFYTHYSDIATMEANWNLHTLGRWDVGANVYDFVGQKTGDKIRPATQYTGSTPTIFLNSSYAGPYNSVNSSAPLPVPNTNLVRNGRTVLPAIVKQWGSQVSKSFYKNTVAIPDGSHPPPGYSINSS